VVKVGNLNSGKATYIGGIKEKEEIGRASTNRKGTIETGKEGRDRTGVNSQSYCCNWKGGGGGRKSFLYEKVPGRRGGLEDGVTKERTNWGSNSNEGNTQELLINQVHAKQRAEDQSNGQRPSGLLKGDILPSYNSS